MTLFLLEGRFAVCKTPLPPPTGQVEISLTLYDGGGYTWVGPEDSRPVSPDCQSGFRVLKVAGPLDFSLTGVLAALSATLAEARVSIFAVSSYDTDYLLVKEAQLSSALKALEKAGHQIIKLSAGRSRPT